MNIFKAAAPACPFDGHFTHICLSPKRETVMKDQKILRKVLGHRNIFGDLNVWYKPVQMFLLSIFNYNKSHRFNFFPSDPFLVAIYMIFFPFPFFLLIPFCLQYILYAIDQNGQPERTHTKIFAISWIDNIFVG